MDKRFPFRPRAREVSRLEAFSDIVLGFALTLIVVSLEVPNTFDELLREMRGFFAFSICFATLMWVWHAHYTFFRRYALHDEYTIVLNTVFLFVVLFYVYPLKFLFALVTGALGGHGEALRATDGTSLFAIYGAGFGGLFLLLALLHGHAWRKRDALELNSAEVYDTLTSMIMYLSYVVIALTSIVIAVIAPRQHLSWAGWSYFLLGPVSAIIGSIRGSRRRAVEDRMMEALSATSAT